MPSNNLPPLPTIPAPKVELNQSGEFSFFTNLENLANVPRNWVVSYERLQASNPNASTYQLVFSSGVGTAAETIIRAAATYETVSMGIKDFFTITRNALTGNSIPAQTEIYGGSIGLIADDSNFNVYKYINQAGKGANNLFSDVALNFTGGIFGGSDRSQVSNTSKTQDFVVVVDSSISSGQSTSITATKTTTPSGESKVSISSTNYNKDQLTQSSQSLFQNEGKKLLGANIKFEGNDGTLNTSLLNQSTLDAASNFLAKDTSLETPILTILEKDSANSTRLFLVKNDSDLTLSDGSSATLATIASTIQSTQTHLQTFFLGSIDFGKDLLFAVGSIFDSTKPQLFDQDNNPLYLDKNGNQTTESYHYLTDENNNPILDENNNPIQEQNQPAKGPSNIELLLADFAARVATGADFDDAALEASKVAIARNVSKDLIAKIGLSDTQLQNGIAVAVARIGIMHMNGDDPDAKDYSVAAIEGILFATTGINPAIIAGIVAASDKIIKEDGKLNGDEYQDVATIGVTTAIVTAVCIKIGAAVGSFFGPPAGNVLGAVVGAVVGYLIAVPLYNSIRNGWEDHEQVYDAIEDIFKGDEVDDNIKEALKGIEDVAKDYTVDFIKDVGIGAITLLTGGYGKELKDGQYWQPYATTGISNKLDGSGNPTADHIIQGLDPQGVVAIAREYYHDDIYGTRGSDNLVGKSGTNTIVGFEGNDHIEGRGDVDLLVGGAGDDEVFGGSGDDQIYGSEGSDNLFGGGGDDVIIGGTGGSIVGAGGASNGGSLEDGDDYVQGGNGDDLVFGLFEGVKMVDFRQKNIFFGFCFEDENMVFANDNQGFGEIGYKKSILM